LDGIKKIVSPDTKVLYAQGCDNLDPDTSGFDEALQIARQADAVILV
jgi:beta-glucosidase